MSQQQRSEFEEEPWVPRTLLGTKVSAGEITSLEEIFERGMKIKESEIVKTLIPDIKNQVISVGIVQKQTDAGELTRFKALVAVGNENGWFGLGSGKAKMMRIAIEKATSDALLNIIPVMLGCGSWECRCSQNHSVPYKINGAGGSVRVQIIPGPRGLSVVAGGTVRTLLSLAGVKDAWTRTDGSTSTKPSVSQAVYDALKKIHGLSKIPK